MSSNVRLPRPADRRSGLRSRLIVAALLALPLLELALLIVVGRAIGVLATLSLLVLGAVAGVVVLRRVGAGAARRLTEAAGPTAGGAVGGVPVGGLPVGGSPGAALLVPAGLLLIVPGFLSDLVGLGLLVPAVRRSLAARAGEALLRRIDRRVVRVVPGEVIPGEVIPGEVIPGEVVTGSAQPVEVRVTDVTEVGPPRALRRPE